MKEQAQAGNPGGEHTNSPEAQDGNTTPPQTDDSVVSLAHGRVAGEKPPLVTPGIYDLAFLHYETVRLYGGRAQKLVLWFRIVTFGEFFGTVLPRYYNAQVKGKAQKHGQFSVGWKSSFLREYVALFKGLPKRKDRIPMTVFETAIISGNVHRVTKSGTDGRIIPKDLQYSVIDELLKVKEL